MDQKNEGRIKAFNSSVMIFIEEASGRQIKGRFSEVLQETDRPFSNLAELILKLDMLMDRRGTPQPYTDIRRWEAPYSRKRRRNVKEERGGGSGSLAGGRGRIATFILYVNMRRNSSWQGEVVWLEGKKQVAFRSVLELLHLIWSACDPAAYRKMGLADTGSPPPAEG